MRTSSQLITLGTAVALAACSIDAATFTPGQLAYIKASDTEQSDFFGQSVALSADGSTLVVGAYGEASQAIGIDGNQLDNSFMTAGAVYVFTRSDGMWIQQAYLKASNTGIGDAFGYNVALSADGSTLAVGAIGEASGATGIGGDQNNDLAASAGAVYVFTRNGTAWSQQAYVKGSNTHMGDNFGRRVALSADGDTLAVSAVFDVSMSPDSGAVYVFTRAGENWQQHAYLKAFNAGASDLFGYSVALSGDGSTLAVGAYNEDSAATGLDGDGNDNSAPGAGAVYVFTREGMTCPQQAYVKASNTDARDQFGFSVALSGDGSTVAVGAYNEDSAATGLGGDETDNSAPNAGAVYVFTRSGTTWSEQVYIKAPNPDPMDFFGLSIALSRDGSTLAVGAYNEDSTATGIGGDQADNSTWDAGAVYVYTRGNKTWSQQAYVKAPNPGFLDHFGVASALSGDGLMLAVGAYQEDSAAIGVGGVELDNSAPDAGAVYVFY